MAPAMEGRYNVILFGLISALSCTVQTDTATVQLSQGSEYVYGYRSFTHLKDIALVKVAAKFSVIPLSKQGGLQRCLLKVHKYDVIINKDGRDYLPDHDNVPLSDWMSFDLAPTGEVMCVYHPRAERHRALAVKKILLGTLSSKLVVSPHTDRWGYRVNETGHEGRHMAVYQAHTEKDEFVFTKVRETKVLDHADQALTKIIRVDSKKHVLNKISVKESFFTPNSVPDDLVGGMPKEKETYVDFPTMGGHSTGVMKLLKIAPHNAEKMKDESLSPRMKNVTLELSAAPQKRTPLKKLQPQIAERMNCLVAAYSGDMDTGIRCFSDLVSMLKELNRRELEVVTLAYLKDKRQSARLLLVDALGTTGTTESYHMMRSHVFLAVKPDADLLLRALFQLNSAEESPPPVFLDMLEKIVFYQPYKFADADTTNEVAQAATFALGSVAKRLRQSFPKLSQRVVSRLQDKLGLHDPYHYSRIGSVLSETEFARHVDGKATLIDALGNAASETSLGHVLSYVNTTDAHPLLRGCAVGALAHFPQRQVADVLLSVALSDKQFSIRHAAITSYTKHPHGGDIRVLLDSKYGSTHNVTLPVYRRMRRSVAKVLGAIWKGFKFLLQSPGVDWKKTIGSNKLGASMGLVVRNILDIEIRPLQGHLLIDVFDSAYVTLHAGIVKKHIDIFKAEICFYGQIEYDLNILKEYGYDRIKKMAELYDTIVKEVIVDIKEAIQMFKNNNEALVVDAGKFDFDKIIKTLIAAITNLPRTVVSLRGVGRKILRIVGQFEDMPPVVNQINDLVSYVSDLFNDIKTDVMNMYNAIADIITSILPWAWNEIKGAFNQIGKVYKQLIKNPKFAIQEIGNAVARVGAAVAVVVKAKDKVVENNIFAKDNRPYWFDVKTIIQELGTKVKDIGASIKNAIADLKNQATDLASEVEKAFTGVDLVEMKTNALHQIRQVLQRELDGPLADLVALLEQFQFIDHFNGIVKSVKKGWNALIKGYNTARTKLEEIFGPKMHKDFFRKYMLACGGGFYPTTGDGQYPPGVALVGHDDTVTVVMAPFRGFLKKSGENQVVISVARLHKVEVIITNLEINDDVIDKEVAAGEEIGTLFSKPPWCRDKAHLHVAMRREGTDKYIDPTDYVRKRDMVKPIWKQTCNRYKLVFLGNTFKDHEIFSKDNPDSEEEKLPINDKEDLVQDDYAMGTGSRRKRGISSTIEKISEKLQELGLPDITRIIDVFKFNMHNVTVESVLTLIDNPELTEKIMTILNQVKSLTNQRSCAHPATMDNNELKDALEKRGKSTQGSRRTKIERYLNMETNCSGLAGRVGRHVYCSVDASCLGFSCCVNLKLFIYRHALTAFVRYDPCLDTLTMGVDTWTRRFKMGHLDDFREEDNIQLFSNENILKVVQVIIYYNVEKANNSIYINVGINYCSTRSEECKSLVKLFDKVAIPLLACNSSTTVTRRRKRSTAVDTLTSLPLADMLKKVDVSGLDETAVVDLMNDLREAFKRFLELKFKQLVATVIGKEMELFDLCIEPEITEGPHSVTLLAISTRMQVGPVPLKFEFGIKGYLGLKIKLKVCILTMQAKATVVPQVGTEVYASAAIDIWVFAAGISINGKFLTTQFPVVVQLEFHKFPLEIRARMNLRLIPLHLEFHAFAKVKLCIWKKCWSKTLFDKILWTIQMKTIDITIFNYNDAEMDVSPPEIGWYDKATPYKKKERRRRRDANGSDSGGNCIISQIAGRHHKDPALAIAIAVEDDRSEVNMTYSLGTYFGGSDVVRMTVLRGPSAVVMKDLGVSGVPLYCSITASNSQGLMVNATCTLDMYDTTPPKVRITTDFSSTSNPSYLSGSAIVLDESNIVSKQMSVGFGKETHGTHIKTWTTVNTGGKPLEVPDDITGDDALKQFSGVREGRLTSLPLKVLTASSVGACAVACVKERSTPPCMGINYDSAGNHTCEILTDVEGPGVYLRKSGRYHHYERLTGDVIDLTVTGNGQLTHNTLLYFNLHVRNILGYTSITPSKGILVDLTPPEPGRLSKVKQDSISKVNCHSFVPDAWKHRCDVDSSTANYRMIVDGEGSKTVFNGHEPQVDQTFTSSNCMIAANWAGFHDDETAILLYRWAVGSSPCADDIYNFTDPHEHMQSAAEWTHMGVAYPLQLHDGKYYVSVQAVNNVQRGPLATTVCHSQPITVDRSPPVIQSITNVQYDDGTGVLSMDVDGGDSSSGIRHAAVAIGKSQTSDDVHPWTLVSDPAHPTLVVGSLPDVDLWVRVRLTNNVGLKSDSSARLSIDLSPPDPGAVYDGTRPGLDIAVQSSTSEICATWDGFSDPQSGIQKFNFAVSTQIDGPDDVSSFTELPADSTSHCVDGLSLKHGATYYVIVVAFNGGHAGKSVAQHSNGVLVDTTPPMSGSVYDGRSLDTDTDFTSDSASVAAVWTNFSDPESLLKGYTVDVYRTPPDGVSPETLVRSERGVAPSVAAVQLTGFHLHDGDRVRVEVTATNNVDNSVTATSDGATVDLTDPVLIALVDGHSLNVDLQYTDNDSALTATWLFEDLQSGIDHYEVAAQELFAGGWTVIYTQKPPRVVPGNTTTFTTDEPLQLTPGATYRMRVTAANGAGLKTVQYTNSVVVDTTPPKIRFVHAGVTAGHTEHLTDGFVLHSDTRGIHASWAGKDLQSGITEYLVAIGSSEGESDVLDFQSMGTQQEGYIDKVNFEMTNLTTNSPVYYVTVKAVNGAKLVSLTNSSSPVKIVRGDTAGMVNDGEIPGLDIDYQSDKETVSFTFAGFYSSQGDIVRYEWRVKTSPNGDVILPYSSVGLIVHGGAKTQTPGQHGAGQAQLTLTPGRKYVIGVRAVTSTGRFIEAESNGFSVDTSPPAISIVSVGAHAINGSVQAPLYQADNASYTATWVVSDPESDISDVWYYVGTYPEGDDIQARTWAANISSIPIGSVQPAAAGLPTIMTLEARNAAGLTTRMVFPALVVDTTSPLTGTLKCSSYKLEQDTIDCQWGDFVDEESDVAYYKVGVGRGEGDDSAVTFQHVDGGVKQFTVKGLSGKFVANGAYYVTVVAVNGAGLSSTVRSDVILVKDNTPPQGGLVIELEDSVVLTPSNDNATCSHKRLVVTSSNDAVCQRSLTRVTVAWEAFSEPDTRVIRYEIALGTTPGDTDISPFEPVPDGEFSYTATGLNLTSVRRVFATVRAFNVAGLTATAVSNGVYVSRVSAGLPPLSPPRLNDGRRPDVDVDIQADTTGVSANWDLSGDPCPVDTYEWTVYRVDGLVTRPPQQLAADAISVIASDVSLETGKSYYSVVRAVNKLGHVTTIRSDGFHVTSPDSAKSVENITSAAVEPGPCSVVPGTVKDGATEGEDVNFQTSMTSLSANWDGFDTCVNGQGTSGQKENISYYEVGAGTSRTSPSQLTTVHPFVKVGLNKTWSFNNLSLTKNVVYYVTVRAYSDTGVVSTATSNGVEVVNATVVTPGIVEVAKYIPSMTTVSFSWSGFGFERPLRTYQWVLEVDELFLDWLTDECVNMKDVFPWWRTGIVRKDTFVRLDGLSMVDGVPYTVRVMATDEVGACAFADGEFMVDITPPVVGVLGVGKNLTDKDVFYTPYNDTLDASWDGVEDPESGISRLVISLHSATNGSCSVLYSNQTELIVDRLALSTSVTHYLFRNLHMKMDRVYYVVLQATNGAGLRTTTLSKPIVLDTADPFGGRVKDGHRFDTDVAFQSQNTKMLGVFKYLPTSSPPPQSRVYDMKTAQSDWTQIIHRHLRVTSGGWMEGLAFVQSQLSYGSNGLEITLTRDVNNDQMLSGAVATKAEPYPTGQYKFDIRAAGSSLNSVTSVSFFDGPKGVYGDMAIYADNSSFIWDEKNGDKTTTITFLSSVDDPKKARDGFGFQLYPNGTLEDGNTTQWLLVVWASTGPTVYTELSFDPSSESHTYTLLIEKDMSTEERETWNVHVYVDGRRLAVGLGAKNLTADTQLILGVYPRNGSVTDIVRDNDTLSQPEATAYFKHLKFPPLIAKRPKPKDAFSEATNVPILKFFAGVGSADRLDDVAPLREVAVPCIPCTGLCVESICDQSCKSNVEQVLKVTIDHLDLNVSRYDTEFNLTVFNQYFLTVKAVTGSGRSVTRSSDGIYIDLTPPDVRTLFHLDLPYSDEEPTTYQGQNHTIAVYLETADTESKIKEHWWSIGSTPGASDIQGFEKFGAKQDRVWNSSLEGLLVDNETYYVTLVAVNWAGLNTTNRTTGVRLALTCPNVSLTEIYLNETDRLQSATGSVAVTRQQEVFYMAWGMPRPETTMVKELNFSIGRRPHVDDIVTSTLVGGDYLGDVVVSAEGIYLGNATLNLTVLTKYVREMDDFNAQFLMEPGRTLYANLSACGFGHVCCDVPVDPVIIVREQDFITNVTAAGVLELTMATNTSGREPDTVTINALDAQGNCTVVVTGLLSTHDLQRGYKSDASVKFKPYIVNPPSTTSKTDRNLRKRIKGWYGPAFYLTTLPGETVDGPLNVSIAFTAAVSGLSPHDIPAFSLLRWCADDNHWTDASRSCDNDAGNLINKHEGNRYTFNVKVCHGPETCRDKAAAGLYAVAFVNRTFINTPPLITSPLEIFKKEGDNFTLMLTAIDAEYDKLVFTLSNVPTPKGAVSVAPSGHLTYIASPDYNGVDVISYTVTEERTDGEAPLSAHGQLLVFLSPVNDAPVLQLFEFGWNIIPPDNKVKKDAPFNSEGTTYTPLEFLLAAYDVDNFEHPLKPELTMKTVLMSPQHGTIFVYPPLVPRRMLNQNCTWPWVKRRPPWDDLIKGIKSPPGDGAVNMVNPCGSRLIELERKLQWRTTILTYTPPENFVGTDVIEVVAIDNQHYESRPLKIYITVRRETETITSGSTETTSRETVTSTEGWTETTSVATPTTETVTSTGGSTETTSVTTPSTETVTPTGGSTETTSVTTPSTETVTPTGGSTETTSMKTPSWETISSTEDLITCITFDHGWDHVQGLKGLWVKNDGVQIVKNGCIHNHCGYFSNGAKLEVPFFKNNFAFRSFSVSFYFRSEDGNDGFMWNGCPAASGSSLSIATDWNVLLMSMNDKRFTLATPQIATIRKWHHFVLSWDGSQALVYIDKVLTNQFSFSGQLQNVNCPLVVGQAAYKSFFGMMDEICLYKRAISKDEVEQIKDHPIIDFTTDTTNTTPTSPITLTPTPTPHDWKFTPDSPKVLTCVTFEHGWDHMQGTKGIYVANHGVKRVSGVCVNGHCGLFNGHSYLSIPFFMGNYQKNGFSVSFFYETEDADATMDLITNLCVQSTSGTASLDISLFNSSVTTEVENVQKKRSVLHVPAGYKYYWHYYVLTWDGSEVIIYMDISVVKKVSLAGHMRNVACPMQIGIGVSNDKTKGFFKGKMDEICFHEGVLSHQDIVKIFSDMPGLA